MNWHEHILADPKVAAGKPVVRDNRVPGWLKIDPTFESLRSNLRYPRLAAGS